MLALVTVACAVATVAVTVHDAAGLTVVWPPVDEAVGELLRAASDTCEALPLDTLFSRDSTPETQRLDIIEYTKNTHRSYRLTKAHLKLQHSGIRPLVVYIAGWLNTPSDESTTSIINALLTKQSTVLLLDTRLSFYRGYVSSASQVKATARSLYFFLRKLHKNGYPLAAVHLVGFSLGAHVAGMAGKLVQVELNRQLGRITALDPAKPCFARKGYRLGRGDAKFVQAIHANTGVLGLEARVGDVDVYINGLSGKQPECEGRSITVDCDHARAWKLYSDSVADEDALTGRRCEHWQQLRDGNCSGERAVLGYACSTNLTGVFLYKSKTVKAEPLLKVFNPFDLKTWL